MGEAKREERKKREEPTVHTYITVGNSASRDLNGQRFSVVFPSPDHSNYNVLILTMKQW